MRRTWAELRVSILATAVTLAPAVGCTGSEDAVRVALLALKIVAGMVVAVLVFLPLMASLGAIRAAVRRVLASRGHDRKPE